MNTFGQIFRVSIYGESHGDFVGIIIDGCPAGVALSVDDFTPDIQRRKSGAKGTTPRIEDDVPLICSGVFQGKTTGFPIMIQFKNKNTRSKDYMTVREIPRPGHADFVAMKKFNNYHDYRGGGHFSGRLTLGIVAAGVIAKKIISPINVQAQILKIGGKKDYETLLEEVMEAQDSIGGVIECCATSVPVGLGEPFFDSFEAKLSHLIFSIPAIRGIEFGAGFEAATMRGSEHNDIFLNKKGSTKTNYAGGINGGITNGNPVVFRVAVKPPSSIGKSQTSFNFKNQQIDTFSTKGRHDACIALRIPVIIEAATAIIFADFMLLEQQVSRTF